MNTSSSVAVLVFAVAAAVATVHAYHKRPKKHPSQAQRRPRVCVFCGSRSGAHKEYIEQATALGRTLAKRDIELVYGGGSIGLMGALANAVDENGGVVHSVIPQALMRFTGKIVQPENCIVTGGMHERKRKFVELSDAFLALPGGLGTFEELCETATWRQLGVHCKPFGVLNVRGFFEPLRRLFDTAIEEQFLGSEWKDGGIIFETDIDQLLDKVLCKVGVDDQESKALVASHEWVI
jgi:uncharacterized protein (TIGR00730 family)